MAYVGTPEMFHMGLFSFIGVLCCVFVYATLCHHEWTIVLEFLSKLEVYKCEL